MHNLKKLDAKGFAHQVLLMAVVVVAVIGGIGSYIYLHKSSAATVTKSSCLSSGGVWKDLSGYGVPHGPCWDNPGAYLINWGAGKTGDGVDHVPLAPATNAETGTNQSEKFNYPNFLIVVGPESKSRWQLCGISNGYNTCTPKASYFSQPKSAPYYGTGGAYAYMYGGAYTLSKTFYGGNSKGSALTKFTTDTKVYLIRLVN